MKNIVLGLLCSATFILSIKSASAEALYDPVSRTVQFDCIRIKEEANSLRVYSMTLSVAGENTFTISAISDQLSTRQCDSLYSIDSNSLVSEIRVRDDIYSASLEFDSDSELFTLSSASYLELSETAMWIVSDGVNELYLGGTIHILQDSDYPLPPAFSIAYEKAETVIFETDPAIPLSSEDFEKFNLPPGESVLSYMSPGTQFILDDFFKKFDRTLEDYSRRRPEFFNSVLYFFGARSFGFDTGVDDYVAELAKVDEKKTAGLETAGYQIDSIIEAYRDAIINWNLSFLLRLASIQSGQINEDLRSLISDWRLGRTESLAAGNEQYQLVYPLRYESILAKRNRNWIPIIESYLETPEIELVLAGFSHFAGPENVLELLVERGYTIRRYVPYKTPFDNLTPEITIELLPF